MSPPRESNAMNDFSGFLYAQPSLLEGVARVVDFGGTLNDYNRCPAGVDPDAFALRADWAAVGESIRSAAELYGRTHHEQGGPAGGEEA